MKITQKTIIKSRLKTILFHQDKYNLNQYKWFRSIKDGTIIIKSNPYTLELIENKRKINFESLSTSPYHFD